MLSEKLLQFIWQFQYFRNINLLTPFGEPVQVISPGTFNTNQGPDFLEAKIKIGHTLWAGNVELHIRASDWYMHRHDQDEHYNNVILHVVWVYDSAVKDNGGNHLPALEMQPLVPALMLDHYEQLMHVQGFVPCEQHLPALSSLAWDSWKERLLTERLEKRAGKIFEYLYESNNHWEEVFWWLLARNFGTVVNTEIFEQMARTVPVNLLAKHKNQIQQLEALLLGGAGLLNSDFKEEYPKLLQREYLFLQKKYSLKTAAVTPAFLRMRPSNFPTIRLAQLAMLISKSEHLFSGIKSAEQLSDVMALLDVTANDYWHYHYCLDEPTGYKPKKLGGQMIANIIINTIIPLLFAYGMYAKEQRYKDRAIEWLLQLPPEVNRVTAKWKAAGIDNSNALHSQALLELKKNYCDVRRCLSCAVGNKILKKTSA